MCWKSTARWTRPGGERFTPRLHGILVSPLRLLDLLEGDLEGDLEAKVLLLRPVERLPVADPQRVQRRVRGELRRRRLARPERRRVGGLDAEGLVQRVP